MPANVALAAAFHRFGFRRADPWKAGLWAALMLSVAIATALGTLAHGLLRSPAANTNVWTVIHLDLWIASAFLASATLYDFRGAAAARGA